MDDLTLLNPSTEAGAAESILDKYEISMDWGRIKFKTKKSRSLVLKGTDFHFTLCEAGNVAVLRYH